MNIDLPYVVSYGCSTKSTKPSYLSDGTKKMFLNLISERTQCEGNLIMLVILNTMK